METQNKTLPRIVAMWDNEGETFDRITLLDIDGDLFGYSENGLDFDQYFGNIHEWNKTIESYVKNSSRLGKRLKPEQYPASIIEAYERRL